MCPILASMRHRRHLLILTLSLICGSLLGMEVDLPAPLDDALVAKGKRRHEAYQQAIHDLYIGSWEKVGDHGEWDDELRSLFPPIVEDRRGDLKHYDRIKKLIRKGCSDPVFNMLILHLGGALDGGNNRYKAFFRGVDDMIRRDYPAVLKLRFMLQALNRSHFFGANMKQPRVRMVVDRLPGVLKRAITENGAGTPLAFSTLAIFSNSGFHLNLDVLNEVHEIVMKTSTDPDLDNWQRHWLLGCWGTSLKQCDGVIRSMMDKTESKTLPRLAQMNELADKYQWHLRQALELAPDEPAPAIVLLRYSADLKGVEDIDLLIQRIWTNDPTHPAFWRAFAGLTFLGKSRRWSGNQDIAQWH